MFQLADTKKSVKWPVKFKFPTDDGEADVEFLASFYFKSPEELNKLNELADDVKFIQSVVDCFHDLKDSKGKLIKGTAADIKMICTIPRIKLAIIDSYYDFNNGDLKNLLRR